MWLCVFICNVIVCVYPWCDCVHDDVYIEMQGRRGDLSKRNVFWVSNGVCVMVCVMVSIYVSLCNCISLWVCVRWTYMVVVVNMLYVVRVLPLCFMPSSRFFWLFLNKSYHNHSFFFFSFWYYYYFNFC